MIIPQQAIDYFRTHIILSTYEYNTPSDMDELEGTLQEEITSHVCAMNSDEIARFINLFGWCDFHTLYRKYFKLLDTVPKNIEPIVCYALIRIWEDGLRPDFSLSDYLDKRSDFLMKLDSE
jgi:hypothetical protein